MERDKFIDRHGPDTYLDHVYPREKSCFPFSAQVEAARKIDERINALTSNLGMDGVGLKDAEFEFKKSAQLLPNIWEILLENHGLLPIDYNDHNSPGYKAYKKEVAEAWEAEKKLHATPNNPMLEGDLILEISR